MVSGIVNKGTIKSNTSYHLGPYNDGSFKTVDVYYIHCKKIPVKSVNKGQYCSIWIKSKEKEKIKREDLRKGMVLLDMQINPISTKIFEADIWTIDGTRKLLKSKYQPILFIKHIRQGCRIVEFRNKRKNSGIFNNANEHNNKENNKENNFNKELKNTLNTKKNTEENLKKNLNIKINNFNPLNNLPKIENLIFEKKETPENLINSLSDSVTKSEGKSFKENLKNENIQKFVESTNKIEKKRRKSTLNKEEKDYESEEFINKNKKRKKSNISQKEENEVHIKTNDYNSDSFIDKEYDQLRSNETICQQKEPEETYVISPNNNCTVVFEFMYYPEYITEDANILISDQLIKAHGKVRNLLG